VRAVVKRVAQQPAEHSEEQEFCIEDAGGKRWLTIRHSAMREAGLEKHKGVIAKQTILIVRDTTAQKQAEQEREASRNLFALAEVATVLAHEIRNPLGSLELLTGLLADDAGLSDDSKDYVKHLQAGVRSLSATVNNVLRFHSLGSPCLLPLNVASTLKNAMDFVRPLAEQSGIALRLADTTAGAQILGDPNGLQQVVLNLVCNALRHSPPDGSITISAAVGSNGSKQTVVIECSDTGCGISPENLGHIFEAGFTTGRQSPGLGLAVCQRLVAQHRGNISVQSELGKGTTFRMEFPLL
jgi:two-component system sensor histidine kinase FlrB